MARSVFTILFAMSRFMAAIHFLIRGSVLNLKASFLWKARSSWARRISSTKRFNSSSVIVVSANSSTIAVWFVCPV
ncbi:hypothetical protein V8C35DRAFT_305137 [Trichoderma chlorosporum]